jgi:hypothetical protein
VNRKARIWATWSWLGSRWLWNYRVPRLDGADYAGTAKSWEAAMFQVSMLREAL